MSSSFLIWAGERLAGPLSERGLQTIFPTLPTPPTPPSGTVNTKPPRDCAGDVVIIVKWTFISHVLFFSCLSRIHQEISYKAGLIFFTLLI